MKRINFVAIMLFFGLSIFAQAVRDRNVIPVAVNLNEVLRMTITNGGNIEFVFNTIDDYKKGLSAENTASSSQNPGATVVPANAGSESFYKTDFSVSSSTRWALTYGAEQPAFLGTDHATAQLNLNNVGYTIINRGTHLFGAAAGIPDVTPGIELFSLPTFNASSVAALQQYPTVLITDNGDSNAANAGDAGDNSFTLNWRCGTTEAGTSSVPMNSQYIIDQKPSPVADRYVVNVLFDLAAI